MLLTVTGRILRRRAELRWSDGELTGDRAGVARARACALRGREVVLPGLGGGPATLTAGARPALIAATMADAFDTVDRITGLEAEELPAEAIA